MDNYPSYDSSSSLANALGPIPSDSNFNANELTNVATSQSTSQAEGCDQPLRFNSASHSRKEETLITCLWLECNQEVEIKDLPRHFRAICESVLSSDMISWARLCIIQLAPRVTIPWTHLSSLHLYTAVSVPVSYSLPLICDPVLCYLVSNSIKCLSIITKP